MQARMNSPIVRQANSAVTERVTTEVSPPNVRTVRLFLFFEGAAFITAALIHFGILVSGYEHQKAGTAESVIGIVLLTGLILTMILPHLIRMISLIVQGFALLGTFVGITMVAIGVGPRTVPDVIYHITIVIVLMFGIVVARGKRRQVKA